MRRRKPSQRHVNHDRWLISYADFITLLFAFFVVMYSTAQVDKQRVGKLALAIQVAFQQLGVFPGSAVQSPKPGILETYRPAGPEPGTSPPNPAVEGTEDLSALRRELEQSLKREIARNEVDIRAVPDGLVISLREIGFFETGSAAIQPHSESAFARIAGLLSQRDYRIRIEGHTDNVPIHNPQFNSNWELSTARATELVRLLITRYGFAAERLSAAGYAQYHPVASNASAEGRAKNRRVDLVVLGKWPAAAPEKVSGTPDRPADLSPTTEER
jgi:chemotaxis protein MotB